MRSHKLLRITNGRIRGKRKNGKYRRKSRNGDSGGNVPAIIRKDDYMYEAT